MSWIAPENINLNAITGFNNGLGMNPWPTFDWNILLFDKMDPLMVPFFNTINKFVGMFIASFVIMGLWYSNTWNTGYLPINSNKVYDHYGKAYNVTRAINAKGLFDADKYEAYSPADLAAGNLTVYLFFFAIYSATLSYAYLYHRHEIMMGFRNLSKRKSQKESGEYTDIHNRLMSVYPEGQSPTPTPTIIFTLILICLSATSLRTLVHGNTSRRDSFCLRWYCWMGNLRKLVTKNQIEND